MKKAVYFEIIDEDKRVIKCLLCPNKCVISEKKVGICGVRKNQGGTLYSLTYNRVTSVAIDPIEKKPLYHFLPSSQILSFGSVGCNFRCLHCQNWEISQARFDDIPTNGIKTIEAIELAKKYNTSSIAYTYNEPLINFEWILETAIAARDANIKNVFVTNGYINEEPLKEILPYIDAANVDVKSFSDEFYKKVCKGRLKPVLNFVERLFESGKHLEVTYLIIPKHNDTPDEIEKFVSWVSSISVDLPIHFSRYFPHYKMKEPPTPLSTLETAYKIATENLNYVYLGNILDPKYNSTYCPKCKTTLIERYGYDVKVLMKDKKCWKCNYELKLVI